MACEVVVIGLIGFFFALEACVECLTYLRQRVLASCGCGLGKRVSDIGVVCGGLNSVACVVVVIGLRGLLCAFDSCVECL